METITVSIENYHYILIIANFIVTFTLAWHALLYKRDPKASLGWMAVILIFPVIGSFLYFFFGINRIRTRARKLTGKSPFSGFLGFLPLEEAKIKPEQLIQLPSEYCELQNISNSVTRMPLTEGNSLVTLHNGESAYPAMLDAIGKAKKSLFLSTYILKTDHVGRMFIDKLSEAADRGVDVKVILDGIGEYYTFPTAPWLMKKRGVRVERFIPPGLFPPSIHINLRNHRKILVCDCKTAFVGGMNIGAHHLAENIKNKSRVVDINFHLTGPVVKQIAQIFTEDWNFITGEDFTPDIPEIESEADNAKCRVIAEGPNEDFDKLASILAGAVASARKRILVMTPYFLPNREMISSLQTAALKGVEVDILLPSKNNLPYVHWATQNMLWELLSKGVNIYYQPPPFVHSKLFAVDDYYTHIGTANIDPRSLRLNFELVVEVYDESFNSSVSKHILNCRNKSRKVTLEEVDSRSIFLRTRDSLAWLFYPYL